MTQSRAGTITYVDGLVRRWLRTGAKVLAVRVLLPALIFGIIALPGITGNGLVASSLGEVPDFSVDTALGKHVFSQQRGKTLVYFFSFPG